MKKKYKIKSKSRFKIQKGGNDALYEYIYQKLKPSKKTLKKVAKHATAKNGARLKYGVRTTAAIGRGIKKGKQRIREDHKRKYKWAYDFVEKQPVAAQVIGGILSVGTQAASNKKSW